MPLDGRTESHAQRLREIANEILDQQRIVGQIRGHQILIESDLAVRHEHGDLRTRESDVRGVALDDRVVVGQAFQRPIELAGALQRAHESRLLVEHRLAERVRDRDGLRLLVVVAQHEPRDFIGHRREQLVPIFGAQLAALDGVVEKDLDVDLVIRTCRRRRNCRWRRC